MDDQVVQAVVFTESFDPKFGPLTLSFPKCLIPLVNRPLLAYTLDMLARSSIQETFIFCNQYAQLIKNFINEYQEKLSKKMKIQVFVLEEYTNMGAAIRDLDAKGVIKSNFVLLNGDCVGNFNLNKLVNIHKRNVKNDSGCIMTTFLRRTSPKHRIRETDNQSVWLLDSKNKIIFFENLQNQNSIKTPVNLLKANVKSTMHYDLIDTHISICSDKVPLDFSDNFDIENREDFIQRLLADDELLQHYAYAHILDEGYATRVSNVPTYDSISRDIIQRFAFPIVPDQDSDCTYRRNNVYLHDKVNIMNKADVICNVDIGHHTFVGTETSICDSVIGAHCVIGSNVKIRDSYIWDNVTIEDNCSIEKSIIASKVLIRKGAIIAEGAIISSGVEIDENVHLKPYTNLINDEDTIVNREAVGEKGKGNFFEQEVNSDDSECEDIDIWNKSPRNIPEDASSVSTNFSDSTDNSCESENYDGEEFNSFFNEVYDSLLRGIEEHLIAEDLTLEINSSKHAYNVPMKDVNALVLRAILKLAHQAEGEFFATLKVHMKTMLPVIQNYIRSVESQNDCIYSIEEFYLNNEETVTPVALTKIIKYLYDQSVLEEGVILKWFNKPNSLPDHVVEDQQRLRSKKELILFTNWLAEAEEESESSDED